MRIGFHRFVDIGRLGAFQSLNRPFVPDLRRQLLRSVRPLSTNIGPKVIFSGIQSTGVPHLGNYLGALKQWVALQNHAVKGDRLLYCVVDLHAITIPQDANELRKWRRETLAVLLAVGLDPEQCSVFYQSTVPDHTELMWILSCMAPMGYLSRMTQWKSKIALSDDSFTFDSASAKANSRLGIFSYPVLQAADIVLYGSTHVPVGEDQVQHLEFTRDCVDAFNKSHGEILVKPQILLSSAKKVMSLKEPHLKMSKSHADPRSRIQLDDSPEQVARKIRLALTDSLDGISYDPINRPGISNLLDIMSYLSPQKTAPLELAQLYSALSMRAFKDEVTASIVTSLRDIQERYQRLMSVSDDHYLEDVAAEGSKNARARAAITMAKVKQAIGLL